MSGHVGSHNTDDWTLGMGAWRAAKL